MQHDKGLHSETRTTSETVQITDRGAGARVCKEQVLHDSCNEVSRRVRQVRGLQDGMAPIVLHYNSQRDTSGERREPSKVRKQTDCEEGTGRRQGQHPSLGGIHPSITTYKGYHDTERLRNTRDRRCKGEVRDLYFFRSVFCRPSSGYRSSYFNSGGSVANIRASSTA